MRIHPWGLLVAVLATTTVRAQPFAYVSNEIGNSVSVINLRTGQVTGSISIGFHPVGVALSADGSRLYVTNVSSNSLAIFNTVNNASLGILALGQQLPVAVAAAPNGQRIYVANAGNASVTVLNASTSGVVTNIRVGFSPVALAVNLDSSRVYVANATANTVSVIDTGNNSVEATVPVGSTPVSIALTPDGNYAYVANLGSNSLSQIELSSNQVTATVDLGQSPASLAVGPDGTAYVTSSGSSTVAFVDTARNSVRDTVEIPACSGIRCVALGVAVSADGKQAYVVNSSSNNVLVVSAETNDVVSAISVGNGPRSITLSAPPRSLGSSSARAAEGNH